MVWNSSKYGERVGEDEYSWSKDLIAAIPMTLAYLLFCICCVVYMP